MSGKVVALHHASEEYRNIFAVNWTLNNICNFSCSYCVPDLYDGSNKGVNLLFMLRFIKLVINSKKPKQVYFEFTGGEVTHFPHFTEVMQFIKELGGLVGIISNGSKPLSWWKENAQYLDHICLTFHHEKGDPEKFLEVAQYLRSQATVHVNVMMVPEKFDVLYSFARRLVKEVPGVSVSLQTLFQNFTGRPYSYSEAQWKILRDPQLIYETPPRGMIMRGAMKSVDENGGETIQDPTLLISSFQNHWKGWNCKAGVENIAVNMNGDVSRGLCWAGGVLGNIQKAGLKLPEDGITCPFETCHCAFDVMSTKVSKV